MSLGYFGANYHLFSKYLQVSVRRCWFRFNFSKCAMSYRPNYHGGRRGGGGGGARSSGGRRGGGGGGRGEQRWWDPAWRAERLKLKAVEVLITDTFMCLCQIYLIIYLVLYLFSYCKVATVSAWVNLSFTGTLVC